MKNSKLSNDYLQVMEACSAYVETTKPVFNEPEAIYKVLRPIIKASTDDRQEAFYMIPLNTKKQMVCPPIEIFKGTGKACYCSPREVFTKALLNNAISIIIAHNHPSGDPEPSSADLAVTKKLIEAGELIDIPITDHIICGVATEDKPGFVSLLLKASYLFG